ncbi:MAG: thiamine diphosphokinase [Oscillospiraceae bacterium]|nr:thiamine diphosphokinase [Oscillospiraceae bacterium]
MRCVIFAAGPMEAPERLREMWSREADDLIIAADGGLRNAALLGVTPSLVLGDMDSLESAQVPEGARLYPVRKDDTDTMLAIKTGLEEGCREFLLFGALGGRLDHTYANIQSLAYLLEQGASGTLLDGGHLCTMVRDGSVGLDTAFRHLSVFSYSDRCEGVSESGTGYTLSGAELTSSFPLGVSNYQLKGERAVISVEKGTLLLILSDHL